MNALKTHLFNLFWWLWLVTAVFFWLLGLLTVPSFLDRASSGTLPTTIIDGTSAAQQAAAAAAAWGVGLETWSWIHLFTTFVSFAVFSLVAALIWWRVRSGFGLLTAYMLLVGGSSALSVLVYGADVPAWTIMLWQIGVLVWPLFFLWLYLFPDGKAVPRRLLWIIIPLLTIFMGIFLLSLLADVASRPEPFERAYAAADPYGQAFVTLLFLLVLSAQIYRYARVSGPLEREQAKSFLLGLLLAFIPLTIADFFFDYPPELGTLAFMALPLGIGVAILRYRLWDIDVIIRRTLLYGLLTAVLLAVYFGLVLLAQTAFVSLTGQESPLAIVISTLVIAALFNPLRRRLQRFMDRRFYRRSYDAAQTLQQFAQHARDEVDIEKLAGRLMEAVNETMQPQTAELWLRPYAMDPVQS